METDIAGRIDSFFGRLGGNVITIGRYVLQSSRKFPNCNKPEDGNSFTYQLEGWEGCRRRRGSCDIKKEKKIKKAKDHEPLSCNLYGLSGSKGLMHKGRPRQVDVVKLGGCVSGRKRLNSTETKGGAR